MEEQLNKIIRLEKENNILLKEILYYLRNHNDDIKDFSLNYIANILSNYRR